MSARALLVVPPFIKYNAGPLLGPALLQAAAQRCGHICSTVDLNALWIQRHTGRLDAPSKPLFQGDHNKMPALQGAEHFWNTTLFGDLLSKDSAHQQSLLRRVKYGFLEHEEVKTFASSLATGSFGTWAQEQLLNVDLQQQLPVELPSDENPVDLVGVSLLHAGQVVPAVAISMLARQIWPNAVVVWGGPHINGLGHALKDDLHIRTSFAADVFVQGHAEETFVSLLDQIIAQKAAGKSHLDSKNPSVLKGRRGKFLNTPLVPSYGTLDSYALPLTLPVQSSLGCAFGKCAFCTYPAMEGKPLLLSLSDTVEPTVQRAIALGDQTCSGISFKDSLVTTNRLRDIADCVRGRVNWSACTKLSARLSDREILCRLTEGGLRTLELGLESLLPETQRKIGKVQSKELFEAFVSQVAQVSELSVVVNYITGFPWEDEQESLDALQMVKEIVLEKLGRDRGKVEHNVFELERLSPMAQKSSKFGLQQEKLRTWPWASIIEQLRPD